jgi:adenylosuccinate lyase
MSLSALNAISPIDGRYRNKTQNLAPYFSEEALIKYRVQVEIEYFIALCNLPLAQLEDFDKSLYDDLRAIYQDFSTNDARVIKDIEQVTNHDVKAVEYFIKEKFDKLGIAQHKEFIHFGLTSQDINNTAIPLSIKEALDDVYTDELNALLSKLSEFAVDWADIPMLARTHGQPASPTRLGKEIQVFVTRIEQQIQYLNNIPNAAKFGGATGNYNAHKIAYPAIDWKAFGKKFVEETLGLHHSFPTTQIEHYDHMAALFDGLKRINTILIDLDRDIWTYVAMDYFKQKIKDGEVGSSAMPHKVNPIDFENSEGNLGIANALFNHLAQKLPISRWQRDLTDSTVLRNLGVGFGHAVIAYQSTLKGISKLEVNEENLAKELENNWEVLAEPIQTVMRRYGIEKPYEKLKELTRGKRVNGQSMHNFIDTLALPESVKAELRLLTPATYIGRAVSFIDEI